MADSLIVSITTVVTAIIGVAIIATLVSKNANTAGVLTAGGSALSQTLGTALSPVTGGGFGSFTGGGAGLNLSSL